MLLGFFLVLFLLDQGLKYYVVSHLLPYWLNSGLMLGLFPGWGLASVVIYGLSAYFLFKWYHGSTSRWRDPILSLFLAGGLSNSLDRFTYHGVIDYIPIFSTRVNISDLAIIASLILLSYHIFSNKIHRILPK